MKLNYTMSFAFPYHFIYSVDFNLHLLLSVSLSHAHNDKSVRVQQMLNKHTFACIKGDIMCSSGHVAVVVWSCGTKKTITNSLIVLDFLKSE